MPALSALRTSPVIQGEVISLRANGLSMRKIGRKLGIRPETVSNILGAHDIDRTEQDKLGRIVPLAYRNLEDALDSNELKLKDRADLSLGVLRLQGERAPATQINIERFASISQLMPSTPSPSSSTSANALAVPAVPGVPGGPKQPQSPSDQPERKASPAIFASLENFSTEQLEAELLRRRSAAATPLLAQAVEP